MPDFGNDTARQRWRDGGSIVDQHGNPMRVPAHLDAANAAGRDLGADDAPIWRYTLPQNVAFLNWVVGVAVLSGASALVALFFLLNGRIDERFAKADDKIQQVDGKVADLRVAVAERAVDRSKSEQGGK